MDQNLAVLSKKVWKAVRIAIFMIRKQLCKKKIFMDLNMMMKRGKVTGKAALGKLMFHHHNHHHHRHNHHFSASERSVKEPALDRPNSTNKRKNYHYHKNSSQFYTPLPYFMQDGEEVNLEDVNNMVEIMLRNEEATNAVGSTPSPSLRGLGFERSPAVRQLRITDSPFPVQNSEDSKHVDQDAEAFIKKFYLKLQQQNYC